MAAPRGIEVLLDGLTGLEHRDRAELIAWLLGRGFGVNQIGASLRFSRRGSRHTRRHHRPNSRRGTRSCARAGLSNSSVNHCARTDSPTPRAVVRTAAAALGLTG